METVNSTQILEKIETIEKGLQRLKIEAYFALPPKKQRAIYPENSLLKSIRQTRKSIWRERYAKKV